MAKNREAVTCNGRAAFFASVWNDIRQCATDRGWAVALHGSLNADMDIMAMPWVREACSFESLIKEIVGLFDGNSLAENFKITYDEKDWGRVVATIPIWADFYLDISAMVEQPHCGAYMAVFDETMSAIKNPEYYQGGYTDG